MNVCKACGSSPVCKTGLCPDCTVDLWLGQSELTKITQPHHPESNLTLYDTHKALGKASHPQYNNKECSLFLGDTVAETVLSKVFKNVVRTPNMYRGFDFWCNNQKKIDVKSSCIRSGKINSWHFVIRKNKIADYFLCIAFDNRQDLNPLHLWLIPRNRINHLTGFSISESTLYKWQEYELPLDKTVACCDTLRPCGIL